MKAFYILVSRAADGIGLCRGGRSADKARSFAGRIMPGSPRESGRRSAGKVRSAGRRLPVPGRRALPAAVLFLLALLVSPAARAQFDGIWTQYMFQSGLYNPGGIALNSDLNVNLSLREQWTSFTNAPSTFALHVSAPVRTGKRVSGLGLMMMNESIGLFQTQLFQLQYAYKTSLWGGQLSAGLQGGILQENFDSDGIYIPTSDYHSQHDEAIPDGALDGMIPDFSLGLWYVHGPWYTGLSCSHLLGGTVKLNEEESTAETDAATLKVSRTIYFTGGYNIQLKNPLLCLQPSVRVQSDLVAVQADVAALLTYRRQFWGGLGWRPGSALAVMAGTTFDFGLSVGYSYDISLTRVDGSHEVFIGYRKKLNTAKVNKYQKSIRIL